VKPHTLDPGAQGDAGKSMREPVRVERVTVAAFAYEVEVGPSGAEGEAAASLLDLVGAEPLDRQAWQRDLAACPLGLGRYESELAVDALQRLVDADTAALEVDAGPAEAEDLGSSGARCCGEQDGDLPRGADRSVGEPARTAVITPTMPATVRNPCT
jgi:hypothetical protein